MSEEINLRIETLETKYDQNWDILGDYQILEISQNKNLDIAFNEILEKITELAAFASGGSDAVHEKFMRVTYKRDVIVGKRRIFLEKLQGIVTERDITPDKLKNECTLQLDLPKFSGYNSKMDFYTFKSNFKKLVEPTVRKTYWADYLTHNYLSGSALILVQREEVYEKIWERFF